MGWRAARRNAVTQFKDSRVVAAFNANQLQYQYMVGSEQRLTASEGLIGSQGLQLNSQSTNISVLNAWINYYNNSIFPNVVYRNANSATLGGTQISTVNPNFEDTGWTITLNVTRPNLLVFFTATEFWVSSGGSAANADLAFQLNSNPEIIVARAYVVAQNQNTYGVGASYLFDYLTPGSYTVKARWRTSAGSTAYLGAPITGSVIQLFAIEY